MITLITRSPNIFTREHLRFLIKKLLKNDRGPQGVASSLIRGLRELDVQFRINPTKKHISGVVHIISGTEATRWCLKRKGRGIKKIIAGPNVSVTPDSLMSDPRIDKIIVPSQWVKDFYISLAPELEPKIRVWAAGVTIANTTNKIGMPILYTKTNDKKIISFTEKHLSNLGIQYKKIIYGKYSKKLYSEALAAAPYMIYIGKSESQGIALHEAWMAGVPSLVYDPGAWNNGGYSWRARGISAPYLTRESGLFFESIEDFEKRFREFTASIDSFSPREYSLKNFTDKISAKKLLEIINE